MATKTHWAPRGVSGCPLGSPRSLVQSGQRELSDGAIATGNGVGAVRYTAYRVPCITWLVSFKVRETP